LSSFLKKIHVLKKDEKSAYRDYQKAAQIAESKRQALTMRSIGKDEKEHSGRLSKLLKRMKA